VPTRRSSDLNARSFTFFEVQITSCWWIHFARNAPCIYHLFPLGNQRWITFRISLGEFTNCCGRCLYFVFLARNSGIRICIYRARFRSSGHESGNASRSTYKEESCFCLYLFRCLYWRDIKISLSCCCWGVIFCPNGTRRNSSMALFFPVQFIFHAAFHGY